MNTTIAKELEVTTKQHPQMKEVIVNPTVFDFAEDMVTQGLGKTVKKEDFENVIRTVYKKEVNVKNNTFYVKETDKTLEEFLNETEENIKVTDILVKGETVVLLATTNQQPVLNELICRLFNFNTSDLLNTESHLYPSYFEEGYKEIANTEFLKEKTDQVTYDSFDFSKFVTYHMEKMKEGNLYSTESAEAINESLKSETLKEEIVKAWNELCNFFAQFDN